MNASTGSFPLIPVFLARSSNCSWGGVGLGARVYGTFAPEVLGVGVQSVGLRVVKGADLDCSFELCIWYFLLVTRT